MTERCHKGTVSDTKCSALLTALAYMKILPSHSSNAYLIPHLCPLLISPSKSLGARVQPTRNERLPPNRSLIARPFPRVRCVGPSRATRKETPSTSPQTPYYDCLSLEGHREPRSGRPSRERGNARFPWLPIRYCTRPTGGTTHGRCEPSSRCIHSPQRSSVNEKGGKFITRCMTHTNG